MTNKHSEKGLKTIQLMNTKPEDWSLTPIRWEYETRTVQVQQACPVCHGTKRTYVVSATGEPSKDATFNNINDRTDGGWRSLNHYDACPNCISAKTKRPTGKVLVLEEVKVLVGYPVWAKDTVFDSRFEDGLYSRDYLTNSGKRVKCVCSLCSKSITGLFSYRVPVQAKGPDGIIHGMWVGQDCAKKILGVEVVLDASQRAEMTKSVYKNFIIQE